MGLFDRLRSQVTARDREESSSVEIQQAERLLRAGASVADITREAQAIGSDDMVSRAWRALLLGDLDSALEAAYTAAEERPYDVDSRIVHGTVRLARHELDHAEHEFEAVIEEFGADSDAADGRRATILARGHAPMDELPASTEEWEVAATLLTTLWRVGRVADERMATIEAGHPDGRSIIVRSLVQGQTADLEADDGTV